MNGSDLKIPQDACFDFVGQVINENMTLNQTTAGKFHSLVNSSIILQTPTLMNDSFLHQSVYSKKDNNSVLNLAKELYFNRKFSKMQLKVKVMFLAIAFNYYFVLLRIGALGGNIFTTGILFGVSEVLGIIVGEPLIK